MSLLTLNTYHSGPLARASQAIARLPADFSPSTLPEAARAASSRESKTPGLLHHICLTTVEKLTPEEIAEVRKKAAVSQAVFARYLNVTVGLVSQWERGEKQPRGPSLKLLTLVRKKGLDAIA